MKVTYFGTTTLLFDDGKDQILFDAHITRPSLGKYVLGTKAAVNTADSTTHRQPTFCSFAPTLHTEKSSAATIKTVFAINVKVISSDPPRYHRTKPADPTAALPKAV